MNLTKTNNDNLFNSLISVESVNKDIEKLIDRCSNDDSKFTCITEPKLKEMSEYMQTINKGMRNLGKSDTQMTRKLITLTMLTPSGNVYRQLRQVLAQIEKVRTALSENIYKHQKSLLQLKEYDRQLEEEDLSEYKRDLIKLKIKKITTGVTNSTIYIEGAFKELGALQSAYKEMLKNNNVPENWDERDYEESEIKYGVEMAFRQCFKDLLAHGTPNMSTLESFEAIGINPVLGLQETKKYLATYNQKSESEWTYNYFMNWLDNMYDKFKDNYKDALKRTGIDRLIDENFVAINNKESK